MAVGRAVAALLFIVVSLNATPTAEADPDALALMNTYRTSRGFPALVAHPTLQVKAQAWAGRLAAAGALSHSRLSDGAPANWVFLGENVGFGPDVAAVQRKFEASPAHERNMVDPKFTHAGVGVVRADGRVWVVQEFATFARAAAAVKPLPAPTIATTTTTTARVAQCVGAG